MCVWRLLLSSSLFFIVSCSSLLYYPSKKHYITEEQIRGKLGLSSQSVRIQTPDGVNLHGWHFRTQVGQPKATIVFFHGNAENISTHFRSLVWILEHGYEFLIFDYRGYGLSEGKPSPQGTITDGKAVVRYILKKTSPQPIFLFGQSLGGAIALRTAIELKEEPRIRAVVIDSSFHSYQEVGRAVLSKNWFTWPFQWLAYVLLSDEYAPEDRIGEWAPKPLVVMHGDNDSKVPFYLGEMAYESASGPKEFWRISQGRHIDSFWRHNGKFRKKFLEFLAKTSNPTS